MHERKETTGKHEAPTAAVPAAQAERPACAVARTADKRGLECPRCGCRHFHILYTRATVGGRILRRRECRHCGRRLTTYEKENE